MTVIWDCLVNLRDDLSASIGSVMDLLAKLCSHKEVIEIMQQDANENKENSFENLVPRLFPFLRHSITNVRKAVLRTILEFLSIEDSSTKAWINAKTLRLVYQNLLVEQNIDVLNLSAQVYEKLLLEMNNNKFNIDVIFTKQSKSLLTLTMTPIGISRHTYSMNTTLIMRPSGEMLGPLNDDDCRGKKRKPDESTTDIPVEDLKVNIDSPIYKGDVMLVGYDKLIGMRCAASAAFGKTLSYMQSEETLLKFLKQFQDI